MIYQYLNSKSYHLMDNQNLSSIVPGDGLTLYVGSDCYPYTVVNYSKNILKIQKDIVDESSETGFKSNLNGDVNYLKLYYNKKIDCKLWFYVEKNDQTGKFNKKRRAHLKFGERKFYLDPNF